MPNRNLTSQLAERAGEHLAAGDVDAARFQLEIRAFARDDALSDAELDAAVNASIQAAFGNMAVTR